MCVPTSGDDSVCGGQGLRSCWGFSGRYGLCGDQGLCGSATTVIEALVRVCTVAKACVATPGASIMRPFLVLCGATRCA